MELTAEQKVSSYPLKKTTNGYPS